MERRIMKLYLESPLIFSEALSKIAKTKIYLKLEALQPSGSFKNRGIGHFCAEVKKQGAKEFICSSGGNAGLAASYAAHRLNMPITVVVPESTSQMMINKIKEEKAFVIQKGKDWQEADQYAQQQSHSRGATYVPPFNHPLIWAGNATIIHEVAKSGLTPDAVIVAVGGGGLYCGLIEGMANVGWEHIPIFAVETHGAASFSAAIDAGKVIEIEKIDTIAKSLGARAVTPQAVAYANSHPTISKVVSDQAAIRACMKFSQNHRLLVEPACGAALSLCYDSDPDLLKFDNVLVIVCGGAAVTAQMLVDWTNELDV
jgi:L-serine/L-threonine ammonia-lyase